MLTRRAYDTKCWEHKPLSTVQILPLGRPHRVSAWTSWPSLSSRGTDQWLVQRAADTLILITGVISTHTSQIFFGKYERQKKWGVLRPYQSVRWSYSLSGCRHKLLKSPWKNHQFKRPKGKFCIWDLRFITHHVPEIVLSTVPKRIVQILWTPSRMTTSESSLLLSAKPQMSAKTHGWSEWHSLPTAGFVSERRLSRDGFIGGFR